MIVFPNNNYFSSNNYPFVMNNNPFFPEKNIINNNTSKICYNNAIDFDYQYIMKNQENNNNPFINYQNRSNTMDNINSIQF